MPWGYDDWLTNRAVRRHWMRSAALVDLTAQILRTRATACEGLACVLDEVFGDTTPLAASEIGDVVGEDVASVGMWARNALGAARAGAVSFQSLALLLPDFARYPLKLLLVDAPVGGEEEWAPSTTWRSSCDRVTRALETLLPALNALPEEARHHGNYIVPLAYAAFLLRDVFRTTEASVWLPVREAIVIYAGGDFVSVPMT